MMAKKNCELCDKKIIEDEIIKRFSQDIKLDGRIIKIEFITKIIDRYSDDNKLCSNCLLNTVSIGIAADVKKNDKVR